jgi:hypothetical protein
VKSVFTSSNRVAQCHVAAVYMHLLSYIARKTVVSGVSRFATRTASMPRITNPVKTDSHVDIVAAAHARRRPGVVGKVARARESVCCWPQCARRVLEASARVWRAS